MNKPKPEDSQSEEGDCESLLTDSFPYEQRKLEPGWRLFECCECENNWREKTRDHASPSGSNCPKCDEWEFPYSHYSDLNLPTDKSGNLS